MIREKSVYAEEKKRKRKEQNDKQEKRKNVRANQGKVHMNERKAKEKYSMNVCVRGKERAYLREKVRGECM